MPALNQYLQINNPALPFKELEMEQIKCKASRWKEVRAQIRDNKNRENQITSWLFKKINKTDKETKKKKREKMQITKVRNKCRNITHTLEKLSNVTKYYQLLDANKLDNFDEQIQETHIL